MIPFVDLNAQYLSIKDEIDSAISACISSGNFIRGSAVIDFEKAFSEYIGTDHCISCGNGTDALEIILRSLDIGSGDEVIVPALSWIATAEAVNNVGAEPVFVDIEEKYYNIDTSLIEEMITSKTKAIIPVHLYGCPADMDEIINISKKYNLYVIEDCAQAHGAMYRGRKAGTFGIASAFSFFPTKNLGAFGDAGSIVSDNSEIADKARMISNHGQLNTRHKHNIIGRNSRLDTIQAEVLKVKLRYLDNWNNSRILAAGKYIEKLSDLKGIILPEITQGIKHVYHLFVIRAKRREDLISEFRKKNIAYSIHYPTPLPFLDAYKYKLHSPDDFPVAVRVTNEIISLAFYPEITDDHIDIVCDTIIEVLKENQFAIMSDF